MNCFYCNIPLLNSYNKYLTCYNCPYSPTWANWNYFGNESHIHLLDELYVYFYVVVSQPPIHSSVYFYPNSNKLTVFFDNAWLTVHRPQFITPSNVAQVVEKILRLKAFV